MPSWLREHPWFRYVAVGGLVLLAIVFVSNGFGGGSTPPPDPGTEVSASSSSSTPSPSSFDEPEDGQATASAGIVARDFAIQYYTLSYTDEAEVRRQLLTPYATEEFLDQLKLGFDPELAADNAFKDAESIQRPTVSEPRPGDVDGGVGEVYLTVVLTTTSSNSEPTKQSFEVSVYLTQIDGVWKVVELEE
jgi:hypothetical protein